MPHPSDKRYRVIMRHKTGELRLQCEGDDRQELLDQCEAEREKSRHVLGNSKADGMTVSVWVREDLVDQIVRESAEPKQGAMF